jgi:exodeoxyribonuclease VII large subunit
LLQRERQRLMGQAARLAQVVALRVARSREALARQAQRWQQGPGMQLLRERSRLETLQGRLVALDPTRVLSRGYALLQERGQGRVIRDPAQLHAGQDLRVTLAQGVAAVRIESAEPE